MSDQYLVDQVRQGRHASYAELYRRHHRRARAHAATLCASTHDADDVTAEAFIKIFQLLCRGRGPTTNFSGYLRRTVGSLAIDHFRATPATEPVERVELTAPEVDSPENLRGHASSEPIVYAFQSLPERWQQALWLTEVEDQHPRQVAAGFGQSPHGFSAMAHRARWGLRISYVKTLLAHGSSCQELRHIAAGLRSLTRPQVLCIEAHIAGCETCHDSDLVLCHAVSRIARLAA